MIFDEIDEITLSSKPIIKVIGVGGAGGNAVDRMIENDVRGVEFIVANTDAQDLRESSAETRLLLGRKTTKGLGAGAKPEVGREAALESIEEIKEVIKGAQMVFITAGMGGGTGTGAAPVIASVCKEAGCLTVAIVTKPFKFEGTPRMQAAIMGLQELKKYVDTLIVIPNERLRTLVNPTTSLLDSFREADNVLRQGVQGLAELISVPGLINVDFADITTVMKDKGTALMGIGTATGPNRAIEAARRAIHSALLEVSIDGATSAIVNISSSENLTLEETSLAVEEIRNNCEKDITIIYGTAINSDLGDEMIVTVIATGYELKAKESGISDIATEIFKNISKENITYNRIEDLDEQEQNSKATKIKEHFNKIKTTDEEEESESKIFLSKKELKQQKKEEKRKNKEANSTPEKVLPDWLKRK